MYVKCFISPPPLPRPPSIKTNSVGEFSSAHVLDVQKWPIESGRMGERWTKRDERYEFEVYRKAWEELIARQRGVKEGISWPRCYFILFNDFFPEFLAGIMLFCFC